MRLWMFTKKRMSCGEHLNTQWVFSSIINEYFKLSTVILSTALFTEIINNPIMTNQTKCTREDGIFNRCVLLMVHHISFGLGSSCHVVFLPSTKSFYTYVRKSAIKKPILCIYLSPSLCYVWLYGVQLFSLSLTI